MTIATFLLAQKYQTYSYIILSLVEEFTARFLLLNTLHGISPHDSLHSVILCASLLFSAGHLYHKNNVSYLIKAFWKLVFLEDL